MRRRRSNYTGRVRVVDRHQRPRTSAVELEDDASDPAPAHEATQAAASASTTCSDGRKTRDDDDGTRRAEAGRDEDTTEPTPVRRALYARDQAHGPPPPEPPQPRRSLASRAGAFTHLRRRLTPKTEIPKRSGGPARHPAAFAVRLRLAVPIRSPGHPVASCATAAAEGLHAASGGGRPVYRPPLSRIDVVDRLVAGRVACPARPEPALGSGSGRCRACSHTVETTPEHPHTGEDKAVHASRTAPRAADDPRQHDPLVRRRVRVSSRRPHRVSASVRPPPQSPFPPQYCSGGRRTYGDTHPRSPVDRFRTVSALSAKNTLRFSSVSGPGARKSACPDPALRPGGAPFRIRDVLQPLRLLAALSSAHGWSEHRDFGAISVPRLHPRPKSMLAPKVRRGSLRKHDYEDRWTVSHAPGTLPEPRAEMKCSSDIQHAPTTGPRLLTLHSADLAPRHQSRRIPGTRDAAGRWWSASAGPSRTARGVCLPPAAVCHRLRRDTS
ncbi:uncharacterized protein TRAVEDRAFT_42192 [Trametes versicolor FP-101664 SS1]|uniref:uncharacterized protein n=1 Tax=Trametes versicolor (strain FP-101664) TaxID=717944 RepID=UPI00046225E8|nr:uncharacterized protein TRAVEDRAFT_42192 [Trametes versicolor FP-101664 SS1]EIW64775.1 hypothetical protein TRAVEDRAFT_42192 [Trametes versicolor FP-101664 SS1]